MPGADVPGVRHNLAYNASALDFVNLYFDEVFFQDVAMETNRYAAQVRGYAIADDESHKVSWTETSLNEIKAWLGINIATGLRSKSALNDIWSTDPLRHDSALSKIMSRNRYWAISRYFHIVDNSAAVLDSDDPNYDSMFKVRSMIDRANDKFASIYKPKQHISVDEAMIQFNGRHSAKQYVRGKPIQWGFKVWVCAESSSGYALQVEIYQGKVRDQARAELRKSRGLGFDVVSNITKEYQLKNHVIYFDRFFSSLHLAQHLLEQQTYVNSTVMLNRKGLPVAIKSLKLKKGEPCHQYRKGNLLMTVFHDKRQVSHLSTGCQPGLMLNSTKPLVNSDYNKYMGGVDLCDQHKSYYKVGRKSLKWWRYIVWYLLNVPINNAYQEWQETLPPLPMLTDAFVKNRKAYSRKLFRLDVVRQLIGGHSENSSRLLLSGAKRKSAETCTAQMRLDVAINHIASYSAEQRVCRYCSSKGLKTSNHYQVRCRTTCNA